MITWEEWFFKKKGKTTTGGNDETVVLRGSQPGKLPRISPKKPITLRPGDKFTKTDKGWHVQVNLDAE